MPTDVPDDDYDEDAHADAEDALFAHCRDCKLWCAIAPTPEVLCREGVRLWLITEEFGRKFTAKLKRDTPS